MRRAALLGALVLLAAAAPGARADGDPASDTLLSVDSFLPFTPPVSQATGQTLTRTLAAARRRGKPLKVAVISSAPDLGSVASLFGQPQKYAEFLSKEDAFAIKDPILVVMAQGFGMARTGTPLDLGFAKGISIPSNPTSDQLAAAATDAVARYGGVKAGSGGGGGGGTSGYVIAAVVIAALAAAGVGAGMLLRARRAAAPS